MLLDISRGYDRKYEICDCRFDVTGSLSAGAEILCYFSDGKRILTESRTYRPTQFPVPHQWRLASGKCTSLKLNALTWLIIAEREDESLLVLSKLSHN